MSRTGRYYIRDPRSGRVFCVEPINERNQQQNADTFGQGGITQVRGGSVHPHDSVITTENGFINICDLAPGMSPDAYIDHIQKGGDGSLV